MTCPSFPIDFALGLSVVLLAGALSYFYFKRTFLALLTAQIIAAILVIIFFPKVL
ncbi:MAG: hypothetical protein ACTSUF_09665 [Candidatus Heimdallarchaeaceae archaeon]